MNTMSTLTPEFKSVLSRISNFAKDKPLLYSGDKFLYNDVIYLQNSEGKWEGKSVDNPYEEIGYIPFNEQNIKPKNKKNKYRSLDNYKKVKPRIQKVMADVSRMKLLSSNDKLENKIINDEIWEDDSDARKNILKSLYEESINKNYDRSKTYSYYKRLNIWMSLYNEKFPQKEKDHYSKFYVDLKEVTGKSNSETTKIVSKIEIFEKLFKYLPSGSWAVCNIPVTFYHLIYRDCWKDIFLSIEKNSKFPYEKYFKNEVLESKFGELSLNQKKDYKESENENEDSDEEGEEE